MLNRVQATAKAKRSLATIFDSDPSSSPRYQYRSLYHSQLPPTTHHHHLPPKLHLTNRSPLDYRSILRSFISRRAIQPGRQLHAHLCLIGLGYDTILATKLVDLYCSCNYLSNAHQLFDRISKRNVFLWNVLIRGYAWNGPYNAAVSLYYEMIENGVVPDNFTFPFVLKAPTVATLVTSISAAADTAALPQGRELHGYSWRQGFEFQDKVKTALVDMYAKSGSVTVARNLFEWLSEKRVVSWNAMITGYAMHGHAMEALDLFKKMAREAQPDHITFVGVLSACNHGGLLTEGREFFESMIHEYRITPTVQHYSSMVDLIGHYGRLDEAYNLIKNMNIKPDSGIWGALLNSCKIHKNVELGELALEKLIELEPDEAGNYVIMSNIYAQSGRWEGVAKLRDLMTNKKLKKDVACSWIEVNNKVHAFLSGDNSHPMCNEINAELERVEKLMIEVGYVPNTAPVFHDVDDDEKTRMVCRHSERLAIAFGLISTPNRSKLLITKNLRVCEDCHDAIKFISKITEREIVFRD
ncbi:Pentatricopeptide repeat-containing protein, partial [Cynara cardunculus var. scolymus]